MTTNAPDLPGFSTEALAEVQSALNGYLAMAPEREEKLQEAMRRLCTEAHARSLGPEQMVIAVKHAWATMTTAHQGDYQRKRAAMDHAVSACIIAYYHGPNETT
ncbi:MAG: hypothetical protein JWN53_2446 [Gemmatimonadetes bacterium]|jgi:hypothetical protein|nr:hypothetical protein [Gemmatimonadota bacterium]